MSPRVQRHPEGALGSPRRLPRGTQGALKPQQKWIQKWTPKLSSVRLILEQFGGHVGVQILSKSGPKIGQVSEPACSGSERSK
jgi:hypothetical protein